MQDERPFNLQDFEDRGLKANLDRMDTEANRRMFELLSAAIPSAKVSLVKQRPFVEVVRELIEHYRAGNLGLRPAPAYAREDFYRVGQIGDFLAVSPRELQGERELYAAPDTADRLRSAYDLDVQTTEAVDEGVVYVFDMKALQEAFAGPYPMRGLDRAIWEPPVINPTDIVKIAGI